MIVAPPLWVPPAPAIIRPAEQALLRPGAFRPCTRAERNAIIRDLVRSRRLSPDQARKAMLFVPVIGWASAAPFTLTYIGRTQDTTDSSTYTFSSVSIGTAASDRLVIVAAAAAPQSGNQAAGLSSGTIAGNAARVNASTSSVSGEGGAGVMSVLVASGTTATIGVTWSRTVMNCTIFVYTLTGYQSAIENDNANASNGTNVTSSTLTLDVPAGGCIIAGHQHTNTNLASFTGASLAAALAAETRSVASGYYLDGGSGETNHNVQISWTSSAGHCEAAASFA